MSITWSNRMHRQERIERLRKVFDAQVLSEPEANMATQVAMFLVDALAAFPESAKELNVEALFAGAIEDWR